ncbi:MAG: hypothetical protein IT349_10910 [Candidatus Eisenbacteria bacterium]|nr:hypothetical protein [Candidatus Eisenbacteria bacterium]
MNLRPLALALLLPVLSLAECRDYAQHMTWLGRTIPDPSGIYQAQYSGVAVSGTYAHCTNPLGTSSVLDIFDLSGSGLADHVGGLSLTGNALDVVAGGNYEYVVAGTAGIHVLDISNPAAPVYLSTLDTPGSARRAVIAAGELLVADGSGGLRIYSLSQPHNPVLLKSLALAGTTVDLAVEGGYAYVAAQSTGTHVVDVDPPNIAFLVRTLSGTCQAVEAGTGLLHLTDGSVLRKYSLASPSNPALLASSSAFAVRDMLLRGTTLFALAPSSDPQADQLLALDTAVSSFAERDRQTVTNGDSAPAALALTGDRLVVAGRAVDLTRVEPLETVAPLGTIPLAAGATQLLLRGATLYASGPTLGVQAYEISSPLIPLLTDAYDPGTASDLSAFGDVLYVASADGVKIVSIADPQQFQLETTLLSGSFTSVLAQDGLLLAGQSLPQEVVSIFDLSDPHAPTFLAQIELDFCQLGARDLELYQGIAWVRGDCSGCCTEPTALWGAIDLTDPQNPVLLGTETTPERFGMLSLQSPPVVLAGQGVTSIELATPNPTSWTTLAQTLLRGAPDRLFRHGAQLYVTDTFGVQQMHIDPAGVPIVDANFVLPGTRDVAVTHQALYLLSGAGLHVYEAPCPLLSDVEGVTAASPTTLRAFPSPVRAADAQLQLQVDAGTLAALAGTGRVELRWIDPTGRVAHAANLSPVSPLTLAGRSSPDGIRIARAPVAPGVYFLELRAAERSLARGRVVVLP